MKRECPQCGFELREMNWTEEFILEKLTRFRLETNEGVLVGFDAWLHHNVKVGTTFNIPGIGDMTLVDACLDYDFENAESMVYMVLKHEHGDCFKITGYRDSYGNGHWDTREFRQVSQQTVTTWVWQENA